MTFPVAIDPIIIITGIIAAGTVIAAVVQVLRYRHDLKSSKPLIEDLTRENKTLKDGIARQGGASSVLAELKRRDQERLEKAQQLKMVTDVGRLLLDAWKAGFFDMDEEYD